jgi:hypothetical protein
MMVRGGGVPYHSMASMPIKRMGPPLRSFAPDAHHCIMVWALGPPHTRMWREHSCTTRGAPLDFVIADHNKCAVVLGAVKDKPLRVGSTRPSLTAPARAGHSDVGSGRRNGLPSRTKKLRYEKMDRTPGAPLDKNLPIQAVMVSVIHPGSFCVLVANDSGQCSGALRRRK